MEEIKAVTDVAQSIGDLGALVVIGAAFIIISLIMWIAIFKWFKSIINEILVQSKTDMQEILNETKKQNEMLCDVSEGLRTETQLRLKNLTGIAFDLSVEQVCRLIKRIREENHIADREATRKKIRKQLRIIHDDRNSRFDPFTYRGKCISAFCSDEWIDQVAVIVESEIYHEQGVNNKRAYTNVKMAYDDIKLDFYHKMNQ